MTAIDRREVLRVLLGGAVVVHGSLSATHGTRRMRNAALIAEHHAFLARERWMPCRSLDGGA